MLVCVREAGCFYRSLILSIEWESDELEGGDAMSSSLLSGKVTPPGIYLSAKVQNASYNAGCIFNLKKYVL